ncbi:TadE/TadG family type IV pilus assembly protein [Tessaracoccus sp. Y36]
MGRHRDERGLSNSVQAALLLPVGLGLFLALLQWAMVSWAEGSAIAAAQQGASVAAVEGATAGEGRAAALQAASNGSLTGIAAEVTRGARLTTATVTGRAVVVVWPWDISRTVVVTTERVTQS